uniref:Cyclic nucleotide-binding domain-containing protein n=1 Tax=Phytophthora ramorum TaxID=164328 RepID=H3HDH9_PHYRM
MYAQRFRSNKDIVRNIFMRSSAQRSEKDLKFAVEYLKSVKFFSRFSFEVRKQLCKVMRLISAVTNTVLFAEGQVGRHFYIIFTGCVDVSVHAKNRFEETKESVVSRLGEGDYFGELALSQADGVRRATVMCTEFCELLVLGRDEYEPLIKKYQNEYHAQYAQMLRKNPYFIGPEWDDNTIEGMCSVMTEKYIPFKGEICKQEYRSDLRRCGRIRTEKADNIINSSKNGPVGASNGATANAATIWDPVHEFTRFRIFGKFRDVDDALNLFRQICAVEKTPKLSEGQDCSRFAVYKEDEMTMALENFPSVDIRDAGHNQFSAADLPQATGQRFACVSVSLQSTGASCIESIVVHVYQCFPTPQSAVRFARQVAATLLAPSALSIVPLFEWIALAELERFDARNNDLEQELELAMRRGGQESTWKARKEALKKGVRQSKLKLAST